MNSRQWLSMLLAALVFIPGNGWARIDVPASKPSTPKPDLPPLHGEWARYQDTLSWGGAACGLVAAEAVLRFKHDRRHANLIDHVRNTALNHSLWSPTAGMFGSGAEQALLRKLGVKTLRISTSSPSRTKSVLLKSLAQGKPVVLSTYQHYFFVEGHHAGRFYVGNTGKVMEAHGHAGAGRYMSIDEIRSVGRGLDAVIVLR